MEFATFHPTFMISDCDIVRCPCIVDKGQRPNQVPDTVWYESSTMVTIHAKSRETQVVPFASWHEVEDARHSLNFKRRFGPDL